jgi:nucleotide-binding universal stress UspA family protein
MLKTRRSFSKVLVAIDGSEASLDAANYAIDVAKKYNAHLNALTVIDLSKPRYLTASFIAAPTYGLRELEELKQSAQKWLDKVNALAAENNIRLTSQIVEDSVSPANSIINYAENEHIDLIVVGTRGRSSFKRLLLGSVASKVVTYASCPVMVVK